MSDAIEWCICRNAHAYMGKMMNWFRMKNAIFIQRSHVCVCVRARVLQHTLYRFAHCCDADRHWWVQWEISIWTLSILFSGLLVPIALCEYNHLALIVILIVDDDIVFWIMKKCTEHSRKKYCIASLGRTVSASRSAHLPKMKITIDRKQRRIIDLIEWM